MTKEEGMKEEVIFILTKESIFQNSYSISMTKMLVRHQLTLARDTYIFSTSSKMFTGYVLVSLILIGNPFHKLRG